jgi:hypothetical protein
LPWLYFTFFGFIMFVVIMWRQVQTSRPEDGRGLVGGKFTLRQTFHWNPQIVCLHSAECTNRRDKIEVKSALELLHLV